MQIETLKQTTGYTCVLVLILLLASCKRNATVYTSPSGYNFGQPVLIRLPGELNEISGIAYYQKDNSIVAECDGKGCIYKISLNDARKINKWKFGKGLDYEDILLIDSSFFLLNSDGNISQLQFDTTGKIYIRNYPFPDSNGKEFESLYFDTATNNIVFVCKKCEEVDANTISSYTFNLADSTYGVGPKISIDGIDKVLSAEKKINVKPSATAFHPITGELYILSSIDKLLVIVDKNLRFKEAYKLDPKLFKQPEGITFTPQGNLFISNEGADAGNSNILFFQYKSTTRR